MDANVKQAYGSAFLGASLFGLSAPMLAVLDFGNPQLTAALLYGCYGILFFILYRPWRDSIAPEERRWLAVSLGFGGILAPLLLVIGLATVPGAEAALWLGAEPILTVLLGVLFFGEHSSLRLWAGVALFTVSAVVLVNFGSWHIGILALLGAAAAWGIDNQASARLMSIRSQSLTAWKGLAGLVGNGLLAFAFHATQLPSLGTFFGIGAVGIVCYGFSLLLVLRAMRVIGGGRAATAFALSPFVGALLGSVLGQTSMSSMTLFASALAVGAGSWLLLSERHEHEHEHAELGHSHEHIHDEHHQHAHSSREPAGEPHTHWHRHARLVHSHPHVSDLHHRHH